MHFHYHLKECILDYGPPSSFWLFACERMNNLLRSVPMNYQDIEIQLMRKFLSGQHVMQCTLSSTDEILHDLLGPHLKLKDSLKFVDIPELP